jgi:hypothetical protein
MQNDIPPFPKFFRLLIDHEVGLLLCNSAAGNHQFLHLPAVLFHLGGEEERRRSDRIGVHPVTLRQVDHTVSHKKPM